MKSTARAWLLLIALSLTWGSSFILMKRGLDVFSSNEVAAIRISLAFIFLAPLLFKYPTLDFKKYGIGVLLMGVFGNLLPAFLFTMAETRISSSLTGMLNALTPLFTSLIGALWLRVRPGPLQVAGVLTGLLAAVSLLYFDRNNGPSANGLYGLLVVAATISYALSVNAIRKYLADLNPVQATVWAFTFIGPVCLIYLLGFSGFTQRLMVHPKAFASLGYLAILAIAGTALAVIFFNVLIKEAGAVFASTCTYLIPVVAISWGLVDYELVNGWQICSMIVVILSVYLINRR